MEPEIRTLSERDYDAVTAVWTAAGLKVRPEGRESRERFAGQIARGLQSVLGLAVDDEIVGVALATHDGRKGWINRVAVLPDHRRRGYARRLIRESERVLWEQGLRVIGVLIEAWNESSIRTFEAAGYVSAGDSIVYLSKRESEED